MLDTSSNYHRFLSSSFQKTTLEKIISICLQGQNLQLIGPSGAGNSLLLEHLCHSQPTAELNFIYANLHLIPHRSPASVSEFIKSLLYFTPLKRTVIILDPFINITDSALTDTYNWLYGLYTSNRKNLSIIFSLDRPILETKQLKNYSVLGQLIAQNFVYIPPLDEKSAFEFTKHLIKYHNKKLSRHTIDKLIFESGGHPQTLKRLIELKIGVSTSQIHLNYQLERLYESIEPFLENKEILENMGLINDDGSFKNRHLANLISKKNPNVPPSEKLSANEYKAFKFLSTRLNEIVTREELISAIWGTRANYEISDHALDQLIHRLKNKINTDFDGLKLVTIRGRGHKLYSI